MSEPKTFWCANKSCDYHSVQPINNCAIHIDGYRLCQSCFDKGLRLRLDVVVYRDIYDWVNQANERLKRLNENAK